jgi:manganese efflux pump family protein
MNLLVLLFLSLLLSFAPFSVALSSSIYRCIVWKEALRIAVVFALFQAVMMAIGWVIGFGIKGLLFDMAVPIAVLIILFIGFRMFMDSRRLGRENRTMVVEDRRILLGFALVISINTALLGMGLGILFREILALAGFIFIMVFLMTLLGVQLGKRGMMNLGRTAEMFGGIGLFIIGVIVILQYLKIM